MIKLIQVKEIYISDKDNKVYFYWLLKHCSAFKTHSDGRKLNTSHVPAMIRKGSHDTASC